jgi:hypothetical protein
MDMSRSLLKSLELFASLCGRIAMPHVILVTTMWSHVTPEVGDEREKQLKESFWHDMIADGCAVQRFDGTKRGAWSIIESTHAIGTTDVLIAAEIIDQHKEFNETKAGAILNRQLEKLIKDQRELKISANSQGNRNSRQELEKRVDEHDSTTTILRSPINNLSVMSKTSPSDKMIMYVNVNVARVNAHLYE